MAKPVLQIQIHDLPTGLLVRIGDERVIQAHGEQIVAALVARALPAPCEVVLNLSAVKAFQSAGLATLARIAFDHRLKVVCTDEKVHRLLDLMGILPVVDVGDDEKRFLPAGFVAPAVKVPAPPPAPPTRSSGEKPRGASARPGERKTGPKPKGKPKT